MHHHISQFTHFITTCIITSHNSRIASQYASSHLTIHALHHNMHHHISQFTRDLGVFIDRELTMEAHVSNTVRGCMYQLCQLRSVKRSLTLDSRRALVTAFVASRIDYCNGVLYGVAKGEIQRLQMVLNATARLVVGTGKFSHVTPILARDCIRGIGPAYFGDVCTPVTAAPGRTNLRSATRGDLVIPRTRTKLGERSFRISAPTVWNSLPDSLKHLATSREHFRKELKTFLFRKAYAPASENY